MSITVKISRPAIQKTSAAGKPYKVQTAVVGPLIGRDGQPEEVPRKIEFMTDTEYQPGEYTISPASFVVGEYDRLGLGRLVLVPVAKK